MKNKNILTPICSAVAILGFFAPWVSCGMLKMSGFDLASGGENANSLSGDLTTKSGDSGNPLLWIVLLAAITIIVIYFLYQNKNKVRAAMIPTIIASGLALGIMGVKYMDVKEMNADFNTGLNKGAEEATAEKDSSETSESAEELSKGMKNMMSNMIKIEWGFWLTAFAFIGCIGTATQLKNDPPPSLEIAGIPPPLPDDSSKMNQDLGL